MLTCDQALNSSCSHMSYSHFYLILSALQTKPDICTNSVDSDETARLEPSHQDLHCSPFFFYLDCIPYCISGDVQIQGWKTPLKKFRDERVKKFIYNVALSDDKGPFKRQHPIKRN